MAPAEYMVRPPQPPAYFFVIDVSYNAVASGMLQAAVNAITETLEAVSARCETRMGGGTRPFHPKMPEEAREGMSRWEKA